MRLIQTLITRNSAGFVMSCYTHTSKPTLISFVSTNLRPKNVNTRVHLRLHIKSLSHEHRNAAKNPNVTQVIFWAWSAETGALRAAWPYLQAVSCRL